jgi:hypothetical protein
MTKTGAKDQVDSVSAEQRKLRPQRKSLELKRGYDPSNDSILDTLRRQVVDGYRTSTYEGKTEFMATVLKNDFIHGKPTAPNDYKVRVRARIEEIHKHLPKPQNQGDCACIDLYPEFVADSDIQPQPGELIRVKFIDRHQTSLKYSNGVILEVGLGSNKNFAGLKPSGLEKFIQCKEKPPKPLPAPAPGGGMDGGNVPGGAGAQGPGGTPAPGQPPPAEPTPEERLEEAKIKCDIPYLLEDLRGKLDAPHQHQLSTKAIQDIQKKIYWDQGTVRAILQLHPAIRDKIVKIFHELNTGVQGGRYFGGTKIPLGAGKGMGLGIKLQINNGLRSTAKSRRLSNNFQTPTTEGLSFHSYGFALDIYELKDYTTYQSRYLYEWKMKVTAFLGSSLNTNWDAAIKSGLLTRTGPGSIQAQFPVPGPKDMNHAISARIRKANLPTPAGHEDYVVQRFTDAAAGFRWGVNFTAPPSVAGVPGDWVHFDYLPTLNQFSLENTRGWYGKTSNLLKMVRDGRIRDGGYVAFPPDYDTGDGT